jgi:cobalamin-dependent methionine synthase I
MKINKNTTVIKIQYIYSTTEDSEVVLVFERTNAGSKKLSQVLSEETSDSSAFLYAM